jgi:hypothetical protein
MKTFLLSVLSCVVALGPAIGAQDQDEVKQPKSKNRVAPPAPRHVNAPPRTIPQAPKVQRNVNSTPQFQNRVKPTNPNRFHTPDLQAQTRVRTNPRFTPPDQDAPRPPAIAKSDVTAPNTNWRARRPMPPESSNTAVQPNTIARNRDWQNRTNNDRTNRNNRDWRNNNNPSGNFTFEQARRHHDRRHHDRSWWRSRYSRIALFGGGYYYWDNNYWFPAYGYDPYYSTYAYDEPIYGYNNLQPGEVIANVQTALQEQGYYRDAVDGLIGPATRAALANYQRDQGLPITSAIDGPTLQSLGLY